MYNIIFQQRQLGQQKMLLTPISMISGIYMVHQHIELRIVLCYLSQSFLKSWTKSSISTYATLLPTTCKQMESANEQSRHVSSTSSSHATIGKTTGEHGLFLLNLRITLQLPLSTNSAHIEVSVVLIHAPCISIMPSNSPLLPQKNSLIEYLQCITTSTISSNVLCTNKTFFILEKLEDLISTIGFWLTDETSELRLWTISP